MNDKNNTTNIIDGDDNNNADYDNNEILKTVRKNRIFAPISPNMNMTACSRSPATPVTINGGNSLFASPRLHAKSALLGKQQSLDSDCGNSDPMIGANRCRRNYITAMPISSSASAPPSPSIFHQQQKIFARTQLVDGQSRTYDQAHWLNTLSSGMTDANRRGVCDDDDDADDNNDANTVALRFQNDATIDQNSIDLDLFSSLETNSTATTTTAVGLNESGGVLTSLLNMETQRSQSVPLSHLQRQHSPPPTGSLALHTPPYGDVSESENLKLEEAGVVASDSTALLDDVDYSVMLSLPEYISKFESLSAQTHTAATTTCSSSAGSSSGYSSGAYSAVSRSVPSTPLPHHHQNFCAHYTQRRRSGALDDGQLTSTLSGAVGGSTINGSPAGSCLKHGVVAGFNGITFGGVGTRSAYDISKSMPTTPITTPCFRFSPTDLTRDFLINGNTIDSMHSFAPSVTRDARGSGPSSNSLISGGMNVDSLIDGDVVGDVSLGAFSANSTNDNETIMTGSDLLDNL